MGQEAFLGVRQWWHILIGAQGEDKEDIGREAGRGMRRGSTLLAQNFSLNPKVYHGRRETQFFVGYWSDYEYYSSATLWVKYGFLGGLTWESNFHHLKFSPVYQQPTYTWTFRKQTICKLVTAGACVHTHRVCVFQCWVNLITINRNWNCLY